MKNVKIMLNDIFRKILKLKLIDEIPYNKSFSELGIDSFVLLEMVLEIEQRFNLEVPDKVVNSFNTLNDIKVWLDKLSND